MVACRGGGFRVQLDSFRWLESCHQGSRASEVEDRQTARVLLASDQHFLYGTSDTDMRTAYPTSSRVRHSQSHD